MNVLYIYIARKSISIWVCVGYNISNLELAVTGGTFKCL